MHRRRDHLGRFLPYENQEEPLNILYPKLEEPQFKNKEEEPFKNPFVDAQEQFTTSSSNESLHLNDLLAKPEY